MRFRLHANRILIVALVLSATSMAAHASLDEFDSFEKRWSFNAGGGYTPVVGGLHSTLSDGWNFTLGTGYKFNNRWGVNLEYMNHHLGVQNSVLNRFSSQFGGVATDGDADVWSVTLNPTWKFEINRVVGGYLIGGGGYYHARAQITTPGVGYVPPYCDYYWGCWPGGFTTVDRIIGERKDDTGGVNVGLGLTFNINREVQFYIESRYHYILMHGPDLQIFPFTAGFRF